jgi:hypothetical protein
MNGTTPPGARQNFSVKTPTKTRRAQIYRFAKTRVFWHSMRSNMKSLRIIAWVGVLVTLGWGTSGRAATAGATLLGWHYGGTALVQKNPDNAVLVKTWTAPEGQAVRQMLLDKLAKTPAELVRLHQGAPTATTAALIRPLLADLLTQESAAQFVGTPRQVTEAVLAIELPAAQAALWSRNLQAAIEQLVGAKATAYKAEGGEGWQAGKSEAQACRFLSVGRWVVLGYGKGDLQRQWVQQIQKNGRPAALPLETWLKLEADLRWLATWLPLPKNLVSEWPHARLEYGSRSGSVRTTGTFSFQEALSCKPEAWVVPTSIIRDPLISFTAFNGAAPFLAALPYAKTLGLPKIPNQLFLWSQSGIPFLSYGAAPMAGASNQMQNLAQTVPPLLLDKLCQDRVGDFLWASNRAELTWRGLPIMAPNLRAMTDPAGQYLVGGLFPLTPSQKTPAPTELITQITQRKNLVYYDWEITQERAAQWGQVVQLLPLFTRVTQAPLNLPGQKWFSACTTNMGNTVTEVTMTGPRELALQRKSPAGFSSFELLLLARWLDAPGFPLAGWPETPVRKPARKATP